MDRMEGVDPDFRLLAGVAEGIRGAYIRDSESDPWEGSPFAWIRTLASRRRGAIGEQLVAGWCAAKGFDVTRSRNSDADRIIAGRKMEIKFSTLWESGEYTFQQIRNQDYEYAICLGISPYSASCWILPKSLLIERLPSQHGGVAGVDTRWLRFRAGQPPDWLAPYGGTLGEAYEVLRNIEAPIGS